MNQNRWSVLETKLPFIRYGSSGWVRDYPVGTFFDIKLSECVVAGRVFSCLSEEKERFEAALAELNLQLDYQKNLSASQFPWFAGGADPGSSRNSNSKSAKAR